jgi:hypothetical protein
MIDSRTQKQPKLNKRAAPKAPAAIETTALGIGASQDKIRERAFELYESRGSKQGHDIQDWLHAEHQILEN